MLFCGQAWGQYVTVKQTAKQWLPVRIEWNGGGIAGLDSSDLTCLVRRPSATSLTAFALTSTLWRDEGWGNYSISVICSVSGSAIVSLSDSNVTDSVKSGDVLAPYSAFQTGTNLPGDATGMSLCFTSGLNLGECFYIVTHDTSAGANTDTIVLAEGTETYWHRPWGASDTIKAGDDFKIFRFNFAYVYSVTDSAGAGGGADTADIRAMMLTATIQRADTTGVAETLLAGGSTGSDTTNIKAALATAHGAGSWLTATGFAVPGSAMSLTAGERDSLDNRQHAQAKKDTIKHVTEIGDDDNIATKVWSSGTRTLTAFSLLTAFDIWTYATRTLTPTGNAQIAESTWTHSPRTLTAGSGSDTTAIGTMLDNRYGINDSTLRTQGVSALGANLLAILALSTADSTPIGGVLATVSDLAFSSAHTWAETNVSGLVRFSLAPDTIGLTAARPTYSTTTDTIIVTGPVTDTLWLAPPPVPIPTSPGRCTVWGDVYNLGTTPSNPRYQVMAYVQPGEQPQYSDSAAVSTNKIIATADSTGRWSLELLQGVKIQIEIPVAGVRRVGTVPASTTANYMSFTATR